MRSGIETTALLDANAIINYAGGKFTPAYRQALDARIRAGAIAVSAIAVTEALSGDITVAERESIDSLLRELDTFDYTEALIPLATTFRRFYKLKLADSMIAATAAFYGLTLVTSDKRHFHLIDPLQLERPEMA